MDRRDERQAALTQAFRQGNRVGTGRAIGAWVTVRRSGLERVTRVQVYPCIPYTGHPLGTEERLPSPHLDDTSPNPRPTASPLSWRVIRFRAKTMPRWLESLRAWSSRMSARNRLHSRTSCRIPRESPGFPQHATFPRYNPRQLGIHAGQTHVVDCAPQSRAGACCAGLPAEYNSLMWLGFGRPGRANR